MGMTGFQDVLPVTSDREEFLKMENMKNAQDLAQNYKIDFNQKFTCTIL